MRKMGGERQLRRAEVSRKYRVKGTKDYIPMVAEDAGGGGVVGAERERVGKDYRG